MTRSIVVGIAFLITSCKFDQLPPIVDDGGGVDAAPVACSGSGPDPSCPPDDPLCVGGTCLGACTADTDCADRPTSEAICHVGSGTCAACDEDDRQAIPGTAEDECSIATNAVCDAVTHSCRACRDHAECTSGICDAGTCVEAVNVIYMNVAGADSGDCVTRATGCLTLSFAIGKLTPQRRYILLLPSVTPFVSAVGTADARIYQMDAYIVGYGATLTRAEQREVIRADSSALEIEGLTISRGNYGVLTSGGTVKLRRVTVLSATNYGISSLSDLTIIDSVVSQNRGGGVSASGPISRLSNNWIVGNGSPTSVSGGIQLSTPSTQTYVEFNTIAYNRTDPQFADGIQCVGPVGMTLRNNIIIGSIGQPHVSTAGNCTHSSTLFSPDNGIAGSGNMVVNDPVSFAFVDQGTYDFHLRPTSVAVGRADASTLQVTSLIDIDGDARTLNGTTVDVGADEIP